MECGALLRIAIGLLAQGIPTSTPPVDWSQYRDVLFLEVTRPEAKVSVCSGVRVRGNLVLTAAHCLDGAVRARVTSESNPQAKGAQWTGASHAWIHSEYNPKKSNFLNDIAAICLNETSETFARFWEGEPILEKGTVVDRIGWGEREGRNARCWTDPYILGRSKRGFWVTQDALGKPGDSGGPLFATDSKGEARLVGIHSTWQKGKSTLKSYAVDVTAFRDWIDSIDCSDGSRPSEFSVQMK